MGLSNTVRDTFFNKAGAALMTTTLLLTACDSGGGMPGDEGGSVNASAQTTVLSQQRGIPVPGATVDFEAGDKDGTDATGDDGIAEFSYQTPESNTPNNVSISGDAQEIQQFSQTESWEPELRTESITKEQRRQAEFTLNAVSTSETPVDASYTVLDNKGDGDGGNLELARGNTGADGNTSISFDYLALTDSVHIKADRSTSQPSLATTTTTTINDLEQAVIRDTTKPAQSEPSTRDVSRGHETRRLKPVNPDGHPETTSSPKPRIELTKQKPGVTTQYAEQQSQTSIDTTIAIDDLNTVRLSFEDQQPSEKSVTVQGVVTDADTDEGYNGGTVQLNSLDTPTSKTAFTGVNGEYTATFTDVSQPTTFAVTTDIQDYTEATDTITVAPPVNGADTTITAPSLTPQRDTYTATITAKGSNGDNVAGADGELTADGESLTSITTNSNGTTSQDVTSTADSLTAIIDKAGWRKGTTTKPLLNDHTIALNPALDLIQYTVDAEAQNESGNPVDVNVTVDDQDGNTLTQSTGSDGQTTFTELNITNGFQEDESIILTYNNGEYNAKQDTVTLNPDNTTRSSTVTLTPSETTTNYTVEGDATSSDGDTPDDPQIHLVSPTDDTVATTTPDNTGFYAMNTTQEELNGDKAGLTSNPPGYEAFNKDITLSEGTNTEDITLQEILRDYTFDVNEDDGTALANASIDIDEVEGGQYRDITELTTGANGETTTTISVDEDVVGGDNFRIIINKPEYNAVEFTHTVNEETKEFTKELTEQTNTVTATINGDLLQENIALPNTEVTARNADADTLVTTTTSDGDGAFSLTTAYPDDQAYTLNLISNTPEHQGDTTTVELQGQTTSYNPSLTLKRKLHELTLTTDDANTGNPVNASGTITHNGTTLANYTTGSDGESTVPVETLADQITVNGDTEDYDGTTQTKSLAGAKNISSNLQLPPIPYTWTGDVTGPSPYTITVQDSDGNQISKTTSNPYNITGDTNNPGLNEDEQGLLIFNADGWVADTLDVTANPDNRTKTKNITLTEKPTTVNATLKGETLQEGQPLPNANVTIRNRDADTTVTTLTSDGTGYYETTTSYPDDQAYTAQIITNTPEHAADTTTVTLGTTDDTYVNDPDLERLIYTVTTSTDDANTGDPVNASGTITNNGTTLANYTTGSNGEKTVEINTDADQITNEANTANYDPSNETLSLGASKTVSSTLNLPPITYVYDGQVTRQDGTIVSNATVTLNDDDSSGQVQVQTGPNGNYTLEATINDGFEEQDQSTLKANKQDHNPSSKNTTTDPQNREKTLDLTVEKQSTVDRIPITFNDKIIGDSLYTGGYGNPFDYTVSTNDTTITITGSTTAEVPIADGDNLEISTSDPEYLSTIIANNTDTEQPPFQVNGFPDGPDYQNTTISIPKSDVVNEYQVGGFPTTSTDGRNMETTILPHVNNATRFKNRQANGQTLDEDKIWIVDGGSSFNTKAKNAINAVREVLPYPTTDPVIVPDTDALEDSINARGGFNYHFTQGGSNANFVIYDSGYIEETASTFSEGTNKGTRLSETYSAMSDMDEIGDNRIGDYVFNDDNTLDKDEAALPFNFEYNSIAGSTIQP